MLSSFEHSRSITDKEFDSYARASNHHPAADDFATDPGEAAVGYYALLKGKPGFCPGLLI